MNYNEEQLMVTKSEQDGLSCKKSTGLNNKESTVRRNWKASN